MTRYAQIAASLRKGALGFAAARQMAAARGLPFRGAGRRFCRERGAVPATLPVGAGRFNTVTTEAVTPAAPSAADGGHAWLQWLLPAVVFAAAAWAGRPRRFAKIMT